MSYYGQQQQQGQYPNQQPLGGYPPMYGQPQPQPQQYQAQPQYGGYQQPPDQYGYPQQQQPQQYQPQYPQQQPQYPPQPDSNTQQQPIGGYHSYNQPLSNPPPAQQPQQQQSESPVYNGGSSTYSAVQQPTIARIRERPELPVVTPVTNALRKSRYLTLINEKTGEKFQPEQLTAARNEHNHEKLAMSDSPAENKAELGSGIVYYFEFIKFIGLVNCLFLVLQVIVYAVFAAEEKPSFSGSGVNSTFGRRSWYHDFMITTYQSSQEDLWKALNSLAIAFCFICAPLYYYIMNKRELEEFDREAHTDVMAKERQYVMVRFTADGFVDVSDEYRTLGNLYMRRVIAWLVLFAFLGIQIVASYFITKNETNTSFGSSLGISVIVVTLNGIFRLGAKYLTEFEKWETLSRWKMFHTIKLLFFKLGNIITVYAAKDYRGLSKEQCTYDIIGEQFITLLLVETIGMNILEVVSSMFFTQYSEPIGRAFGSVLGDQDLLAPFDLAMQYLTTIYRQYLCIMAMVVCPLSIALGGVIGFFVQFWVDKFRLFKICGRPRKMDSSQKGFLSALLICIAVVSMFTPFAGSVFMMAGITRDTSKQWCKFP